MGYKYKSTMYYSDEDTKLHLEEQTKGPGSKRGSASKYLYSLVTDERKKTRTEKNDIVDRSEEARQIHTLNLPFRGGKEMETKGSINFTSITQLMNISNNNLEPKSFMNEIDKKIENYFYENNKLTTEQKEDSFFILLRTSIKCSYSEGKYTKISCDGVFFARWIQIEVNRSLWNKFHGLYDFTKIKYFRYDDIMERKSNIPKGLCKIHETSSKDKKGAFFIPVRSTSKAYPSRDEIKGFISIKGVDIFSIKERVEIKSLETVSSK